MRSHPVFELFDPADDLRITRGNLPHWYQPGVTYFVTFRTDDSIPSAAAALWYRRRNDWLWRHGINPCEPGWQKRLHALPASQQREYHDTFTREFLESLDRGHGKCLLRQPQFARIVADSLLHFDGSRYHMGDFVVMPNHVHLLVCLLGDTDIETQCYSWKKFTANKINRALENSGRFWQEESFDHLVRSVEQFERIQRYIRENPCAASLRVGEYLCYQRPK
jgi:REP element-mobilizing transposase RayT